MAVVLEASQLSRSNNMHSRNFSGIEICFRPEKDEEYIPDEVIVQDCYNLRSLRPQEFQYVLDIGGHIGSFVCLAACLWPSARIATVEPHPETCEVLRRNVARYGSRVQVIHAAVAKVSGEAQLCEAHSSMCLLDEFWPSAPAKITVPAYTMQEILAITKFPRIDFLKLDCEGGEYIALQQLAEARLLSRVGLIRGEWHIEAWNDRIERALAATHSLTITKPLHYDQGYFWAHRSSMPDFSLQIPASLS